MPKRIIIFLLQWLLLAPFVVFAGDPPSRAGADGPHVFYKGKKIIVHSVVIEDSLPVARKSVFRRRHDVLLTCTVPATGDAFTFGLMDTIIPPPSRWPATTAPILALSDIEGNFKGFKMMLLGAGVMDESFNWTFKNGHLVLLGDYFDRGTQVTECLWLAYKLDMEARAAGGAVHFILGNHEVMNLSGDFRYVIPKYMENARLIGERYHTWYTDNTELGRWLRSKNAVECIGDVFFCHGGLSPQMAALTTDLELINDTARKWYGEKYIPSEHPLAAAIFDGDYGIFWYREMSKNKLKIETVRATFERFGAQHVVVGHTLVPEVRTSYEGLLVCIDLFHEDHIRQGFMNTLLIEKGRWWVVDT